jgi:hypothetical protein
MKTSLSESQQADDEIVNRLLFFLDAVSLDEQLPLVELLKARLQIKVNRWHRDKAAWSRDNKIDLS